MHPKQRRGHFGAGGGRRGGGGPGAWRAEPNEAVFASRGVLDRNELQVILLSLIGAEPRHGYELIRSIKALSGGVYAPSSGVVYPALSAMEEQGLVSAGEAEAGRKTFTITSQGKAELGAKTKELTGLKARLKGLAETDIAQFAPVRRAMSNLYAVLDNVAVGSGGEALAHEIAGVIDEAAQKIERLK